MAEILYGYFDGLAARYNGREAWVLNEDRTKWNRISTHDDAIREITKNYYDERFPNAPPLPPEAFKSAIQSGSMSSTRFRQSPRLATRL
jgi:hypothetical protein